MSRSAFAYALPMDRGLCQMPSRQLWVDFPRIGLYWPDLEPSSRLKPGDIASKSA